MVSQKGGHRFQVKLHPVERPLWKSGQREKTLIISDPHGDLESFVSVLRNNGVIGKNYKWKFGKNQVIVIGDVFDRGKDVLPFLVDVQVGTGGEGCRRGDDFYVRESRGNGVAG